MPLETPTPDVQADPVSELTGSEDEAAAAFAARDTAQAETPEPEPADEAAEDEATEADEADPDAEEEAEELVEVEADDGKTYKVPPAVQKAMLRQSDYSRKMNEVGAQEKVYAERLEQIEAVSEAAEKRADALAEVRMIDARIKQYEGIDWTKAKTENPADAAFAAVELLALQEQRREAVQKAANVARELTDGRNKLVASQRLEMGNYLKKELKGWGEELGEKLTKYADEKGIQRKTLENLTDPAIVIALDKARRYDEMQAAKTALKGKVAEAPKVVKPGARRQAEKPDVMARLRVSNSQEDAEAAFLSRMR